MTGNYKGIIVVPSDAWLSVKKAKRLKASTNEQGEGLLLHPPLVPISTGKWRFRKGIKEERT